MSGPKQDRRLQAARRLAEELGARLDLDLSLELWDGSTVPLGKRASGELGLFISSAGALTSLLRRPSMDRLIRHYALGDVGITGGTIIDVGEQLSGGGTRRRLKGIGKIALARHLAPLLFGKAQPPGASRAFGGDAVGAARKQAENKDFIQFHYDVGNDFYRLFLDPEMQYSCAYFTDWEGPLKKAQVDKLEMICRKLRLKPGESLLDIGCGWGGLICHAARHHGVKAHGITLSQEQLALTRDKIARLGLDGQVTAELKDYAELDGSYDKIASIGMYEHIGIANIPLYLQTVRRLLADEGLFLNHAISRRAKKKRRRFGKRPEQRALQRYIFPGGELDDIGHTVAALEQHGFEVHDVEAWRYHYARTTKLWCERLTANQEQAVALVGPETYRIWVAYLGGCSLAFSRGSARIYQTLVSKSAKGMPPLPPTRADLYASG